jgi:hypothetical protein
MIPPVSGDKELRIENRNAYLLFKLVSKKKKNY